VVDAGAVSILPGLQQLVREGGERVMRAALNECQRLTAEAAPAPETGELNRSIVTDEPTFDGSTFTGAIRATAQHASYTDEGTGIYVGRGRIYPRTARVLRFYWFGGPRGPAMYYFPSVAGQPGQHWFARPMEARWREALTYADRTGAWAAG
jgi:hypothetical protein